MSTLAAVVYAGLAGILPALLWLYFLLREDAKNPEPKYLIALTFVGGMAAVLIALPIEHFACSEIAKCGVTPKPTVLVAWAFIEETLKYGIASALILWRRDVDEPIDYVIYMITAALGFAALENALFLIAPFSAGNILGGFLTDNLRFVGSTLLHVLASASIGFALAFSYRRQASYGEHALGAVLILTGLILAITLHVLFNFLIISQDGSTTFLAFLTVWTGIVIFLALFEVLKYYERKQLPAQNP